MFIKYEEMLLNSKPAPLTSIFEGFMINYGGFEKFTQSIHPLYGRDNKGTHEKTLRCEDIIKSRGFESRYRIVFQNDYKELDEELFKSGYERESQGTVKGIDISNLQRELFTFANFIQNGVYVEEELKDFWLSDYSYLMNIAEYDTKALADSIRGRLSKFVYFTLIEENILLGQGYVTFQEEFMIINNIIINPKYRRLSYGRRLLMSMLSYGFKQGASIALADVFYDDIPSNKLFQKVNFEDIYGYCYRVKK